MKKIILPLVLLMTAGLFVQCKSQPAAAKTGNIANPPVKNVILLIGDGMGIVQTTSAMIAADGPLAIERAPVVGLQTTRSANRRVTDSAAAGTALATGTKTDNGMIGVAPDTTALTSVLEKAVGKGLSTGLVATYRITHATPASFIAHVPDRNDEEEIAADFLDTDITLFIGGGRAKFEQRADGRNLSDELKAKGYRVAYTEEELKGITSGKVAGLLADSHLPDILGGRNLQYLANATDKALEILSQNDRGFFVMVEGSMIDGGGHDNSIDKIVAETLDFDRAVARAFAFADTHPGTLVVVTADHETGGLTIPADGSGVEYLFSTGGHTATMIPVYAYGTGAERFGGTMDNTDIPKRIAELLKL
jgi:alkaline phosphatase